MPEVQIGVGYTRESYRKLQRGRLSISGGLGRLSISGGLGSESYRNEAVCLISGGLGWPFVYLRWFRLRELRGRLSISGGL